MKNLAFILFTIIFLGIVSCSGEENRSIEKNKNSLLVKTYGNVNSEENGKIIFTGDDIRSFNETTGEIIFNKNVSFSGLTGDLTFYLDENNLFNVQYILPIASYLINDLVLHAPGIDGKYYLNYGYPEVVEIEIPNEIITVRDTIDGKVVITQIEKPGTGGTITNITPENIAAREENKQKRAAEWAMFIKWLDDAGKLIR
ncbi:MAG: hypothetical protein LBV74_07110 [Tannerella sp.]|jgi:hypothetical protein|nr:hypothetical protein [Tannerella sp.]